MVPITTLLLVSFCWLDLVTSLLSWLTCTMARTTGEASTKNSWLTFSVRFFHHHNIETMSKFLIYHHVVSAWLLSSTCVTSAVPAAMFYLGCCINILKFICSKIQICSWTMLKFFTSIVLCHILNTFKKSNKI